jgi:hypothetical protein
MYYLLALIMSLFSGDKAPVSDSDTNTVVNSAKDPVKPVQPPPSAFYHS